MHSWNTQIILCFVEIYPNGNCCTIISINLYSIWKVLYIMSCSKHFSFYNWYWSPRSPRYNLYWAPVGQQIPKKTRFCLPSRECCRSVLRWGSSLLRQRHPIYSLSNSSFKTVSIIVRSQLAPRMTLFESCNYCFSALYSSINICPFPLEDFSFAFWSLTLSHLKLNAFKDV